MKFEKHQSILLISNFLEPKNGSYGVCHALASQLRTAGWDVVTASARQNRLLRLSDMLATIITQRRRYQLAQVDVFSGDAFLWAEMSCRLLRWLRKPYILTLHGGNLPEFASRNEHRVQTVLRGARHVTVPSEYLRSAMQPYRRDLILLPNPIQIERYPFRLRDHPQPKLIWLRAFHQIYNPELAVRVVHLLRSEHPDVHLTMVGPDKGDGSLQRTLKLVDELGLQNHVEFIGGIPKEDVPLWLAKGDVFLNTTNVDNTPVSVQEAMACGLCIASTNIGGVPYLIQNEENALLVPPNHMESMVTAVKRILNESDLSTKLSTNARKKSEEHDWVNILPKWEKLFRSVSN